jgi:hypothetical protein
MAKENDSSGVGGGTKLSHGSAMADSTNSLELWPTHAMTLRLERDLAQNGAAMKGILTFGDSRLGEIPRRVCNKCSFSLGLMSMWAYSIAPLVSRLGHAAAVAALP